MVPSYTYLSMTAVQAFTVLVSILPARLDWHAKAPEDVMWAPIPLLTLLQKILLADSCLAPVHLTGCLAPVTHTDSAGHMQASWLTQLIVLLEMTCMCEDGRHWST
jgi:hypothetical protein